MAKNNTKQELALVRDCSYYSDVTWEKEFCRILKEHGIEKYDGSRFDIFIPELVPFEDGDPRFRQEDSYDREASSVGIRFISE